MKIKNQFRISIITFGVILAVIAASVIITQQQVTQLNSQTAIAQDIQTRASSIGYFSNNYFLYRDSAQLNQWQLTFASLFTDISNLHSSSAQQQMLINNVKVDAQQLNATFTDAVSLLQNIPPNESLTTNQAFQNIWSRMAAQNQALAFDAQQLVQAYSNQVNQLNTINVILIFAFLGIFGIYLIATSISDDRSG
jgi:hypothetical protein